MRLGTVFPQVEISADPQAIARLRYPRSPKCWGLAGYEASSRIGLIAPAGTPPSVVSILNSEIDRLLQRRDVLDQLAERACVPAPRTPRAFSDFIASKMAKWAKLMREFGLNAE